MTGTNEKFDMMGFISEICDDFGPRLGTSESETKAGLRIKKIMEEMTDETAAEEFTCHPRSFMDYIYVTFSCILIGSIIFYWYPVISLFLYVLGFAAYFLESTLLLVFVDFLLPTAKGSNIIGKIKPTNETKQIILFSGHHDSAYESPMFVKLKEKVIPVSILSVASIILSILSAIIKSILDPLGVSMLTSNILLMVFPVLAVFLIGFTALNMHSDKVVLGANDNLSGVSVILSIAKYFFDNRPRNVELRFVSFSCEECMRGSKRFVEKHSYELENNSITINFDGLGVGDHTIASAEPFFVAKHSMELAEKFQKSSDKAGASIPIKIMPFGGTDAAFFSRNGLKAISVVGFPIGAFPESWHNMLDAPAIIEAEKLDRMSKISIQFVQDQDESLNGD